MVELFIINFNIMGDGVNGIIKSVKMEDFEQICSCVRYILFICFL